MMLSNQSTLYLKRREIYLVSFRLKVCRVNWVGLVLARLLHGTVGGAEGKVSSLSYKVDICFR
jgi:hypothetical protein